MRVTVSASRTDWQKHFRDRMLDGGGNFCILGLIQYSKDSDYFWTEERQGSIES